MHVNLPIFLLGCARSHQKRFGEKLHGRCDCRREPVIHAVHIELCIPKAVMECVIARSNKVHLFHAQDMQAVVFNLHWGKLCVKVQEDTNLMMFTVIVDKRVLLV